jgi:YgiT-type zinc finger domain-containing protein
MERITLSLIIIGCGEYSFMKNFMDCSCRNQKRKKVTKEIRLAGTTVLLENVTAWECQDCGEFYFDGKYLMDLERKLLANAKDAK